MDLSWINGAVCAGAAALPFLVMGGVALRNVLRERRAALTVPRYRRRWRVTHVARDAHGLL